MSCSAFISEIVRYTGLEFRTVVSLTRDARGGVRAIGPRGGAAGRSGEKDGPVGCGCAEIHAIGARRPPPLGGRRRHAPRRRHGP